MAAEYSISLTYYNKLVIKCTKLKRGPYLVGGLLRMRILVTLGQLILVLIVLVFILYKLALALDMVPEDFSPKGMAHTEYKLFKDQLKSASVDDDLQGKLARIAWVSIDKTETYFTRDDVLDAQQKRIAESCQENSIMRFFMFMGKDSVHNKNCIKQNMRIEHEINNNIAKPASGTKTPVSIHPKDAQQQTTTPADPMLNDQQKMEQYMLNHDKPTPNSPLPPANPSVTQ